MSGREAEAEPAAKRIRTSTTDGTIASGSWSFSPEQISATRPSLSLSLDGNVNQDTFPEQVIKETAEASQEEIVGITEFVAEKQLRFSGIFKKRYTDFLVNEILPSGEVLHLTNVGDTGRTSGQQNGPQTEVALEPSQVAGEAEKAAPSPTDCNGPPNSGAKDDVDNSSASASDLALTPEDEAELLTYFDEDVVKSILAMNLRALRPKPRGAEPAGTLTLPAVQNKDTRTKIHQSLRRIFASRLETIADGNGRIVVSRSAGARRRQRDPRRKRANDGSGDSMSWDELGGQYLHFTLYKENKDTMEVTSFLARQLRLPPKTLQFAGTKDRRAVTVQRASVFRVHAKRLAGVNASLRGAKLGGFTYHSAGLELGDLAGNEFVISLRQCTFPSIDKESNCDWLQFASKSADQAMRNFNEKGFLNYYGLQRFGAFAARTDSIGMEMLKGNFQSACDRLLSYNSAVLGAAEKNPGVLVSSDDIGRAKAIHLFKSSGQADAALKDMPRRFAAESTLIRHLGSPHRSADFQGALQGVPRNLRLMYVHAYQSLVWNVVASERWKRFGAGVVEGDLVLIGKGAKQAGNASADQDPDDKETGTVGLDGGSKSVGDEDDPFQRARPLSKDEADSGKWSIYDVVLPTPGFDVVYPANTIATVYEDFMGSKRGGGLDPHNMRRKWRDISLSGSYRKLLARSLGAGGATYEIRPYQGDDEQLVETDLDRLRTTSGTESSSQAGRKAPEVSATAPTDGPPTKMAVIIRLQLSSSQYATMALRELLGPGGLVTYKPEYAGGR